MKKLFLLLALLIPSLCFGQALSGHNITSISSANTNNSTSVKPSAAAVYEVVACNTNAAARFVKLYNKATAPTCGTDTPYFRLEVAPSTCAPAVISTGGMSFPLGLGYCIVTGKADSDNTAPSADDVQLNIGFK